MRKGIVIHAHLHELCSKNECTHSPEVSSDLERRKIPKFIFLDTYLMYILTLSKALSDHFAT